MAVNHLVLGSSPSGGVERDCMKVRKTVEMTTEELLQIIRKAPGLDKAESVYVAGDYATVEWTDDEVLDGIYEGKK